MKINVTNTEKLDAELARINGRATSHTAKPRIIRGQAESAERELQSKGLAKKDLPGVSAVFCSSPKMPSAYKNTRLVNFITIERFATGWFVTKITKSEVYPDQDDDLSFKVSRKQADKITKHALKGIQIDEK